MANFNDMRFGNIETEILPMSITIIGGLGKDNVSQELNVWNLDPREAWALIDLMTEKGFEVKVHERGRLPNDTN